MAPADVLPLADLRVVDLTIARAGPTCVRQLADWGADVVRVEPLGAGAGDSGRHGSDFQNLHRNKRAISIDLKQPDGLELLLRLADGADVLVENMRPAVKSRLGFDYEAVHRRNPRLVYASLSGFGQDGPYADRGGVDQIAQGMGGLMSVTGLPGTEPTRVGIPVADLSAGLYLAIGVLVALHERERTGIGRWVQTSLLEAMIAMMDLQATRWTMDGVVAAQEGNHHPTQVPMGCFRSADGFVNIAGAFGRLLRRFCDAIGLPDLPTDPRFDTTAKRSANRAELNRLIGDQLLLRTHRGMGRGPQCGRCAVWTRPEHRRGLRRSAGHPPGHGGDGDVAGAGRRRHPAQRGVDDRWPAHGPHRHTGGGRAHDLGAARAGPRQ